MQASSSPRKRVSDAERDQVAAHLGHAFAEGRLGLEEFDRRNSAAYEAVFDDELRELVADLPAPGASVAVGEPIPSAPSEQEPVELTSSSGTLRRSGDWAVPRRLRVNSLAGSVRLDMSRASIPHPVVDIQLAMYTGSTVLILPPGATADINGLQAVYASLRSKVPGTPRPTATHFVIAGQAYTGAVRIRYPRGGVR